jgi:hypothetical protein
MVPLAQIFAGMTPQVIKGLTVTEFAAFAVSADRIRAARKR